MTIIYSNMLDEDCRILQRIWRNIPNINLVEITPQSENWEDEVDDAISKEIEILLFLGHGTTNGLLFPNFDKNEYILHENNINLIKADMIICCWCYASIFCQTYNLIPSFSTSMFISNIDEAINNGYSNYTQSEINNINGKFYDEINYLLINNIPLNKWITYLRSHLDIKNGIDFFNRDGLMVNL